MFAISDALEISKVFSHEYVMENTDRSKLRSGAATSHVQNSIAAGLV
jgi:hypothetical protein